MAGDELVWVATALNVEDEAVLVGVGKTAEAANASLRANLQAEAVRVGYDTIEELLQESGWELSEPQPHGI